MIFIQLNLIYTFLIQDGHSLKYLKIHDMGLIMTVEQPDTATQWELIPSVENPIILSIRKQGTDLCLEKISNINSLFGAPCANKEIQRFKLNLRSDGYYNIVQDDRLYLYYDIVSSEIKTGKSPPGFAKGFRFITDDGAREWPNHILIQHDWL